MVSSGHRRWGVGWMAGGLAALVLIFASLNAFNLPFLLPRTPSQLFFFTGLSALVFLVLLALLVLLFRTILKMYADERSRVLGSRIRTRMLVGALLLSFAPALFLFLFSYVLMNRTVDRWFSQPVSQMRTESSRIAVELEQYAAANARAEAASLAASPAVQQELARQNYQAMHAHLEEHRITLEGGFVLVYKGQQAVARFQTPANADHVTVQAWGNDEQVEEAVPTPSLWSRAKATAHRSSLAPRTGTPPAADDKPAYTSGRSLEDVALESSRRSDEPILGIGDTEYITAASPVAGDYTIKWLEDWLARKSGGTA